MCIFVFISFGFFWGGLLVVLVAFCFGVVVVGWLFLWGGGCVFLLVSFSCAFCFGFGDMHIDK